MKERGRYRRMFPLAAGIVLSLLSFTKAHLFPTPPARTDDGRGNECTPDNPDQKSSSNAPLFTSCGGYLE